MIYHITGEAQSGKSQLANSLRNAHIGKSKQAREALEAEVDEEGNEVSPALEAQEREVYGALLVDDTQEGETVYLLEKLVHEDTITPGQPASEVNWKLEPMIIFVGNKISLLDEFEELAPGITELMGPVKTLPLS